MPTPERIGAAALETPYAHHTDAPGTAVVLQHGLRVGHMYAQTQGRLLLSQCYPQLHSVGNPGQDTKISATTWRTVAEGKVYVPEHASLVVAVVSFVVYVPATVHHRLTLVDESSDTDTGPDVTQDYEISAGNLPHLSGPEAAFSAWDMPEQIGECYAEFSTARPGEVIRLSLEAYAVDADGNAAAYRPGFVTAWWEFEP